MSFDVNRKQLLLELFIDVGARLRIFNTLANLIDILQGDIDSLLRVASQRSIVTLISTLEYAATIRSLMQMRAHAPAVIAVFNGGHALRNAHCYALVYKSSNYMTVDHAGRTALLLFECANRVITTSARRAHARLISSELRFRLYCPTRVPETRLSFPPGVIASLNAQIIPIVFFRVSLYPGREGGRVSYRYACCALAACLVQFIDPSRCNTPFSFRVARVIKYAKCLHYCNTVASTNEGNLETGKF